MLIQITERDSKYLSEITLMLISVHNAKGTGNPRVLEVADDFDVNLYHGVAPASSGTPSEVPAKVREWLDNYKGSFEFYLSLKSQLSSRGSLSPKQIACVERAIERDAQRVSTPAAPKNYSYKCEEVLLLSKSFAKKVALQAGYCRPHYAVEVLNVHAETAKAVLVTVRLSAQRTSYCGCCGAYLSNPQSVAAGIGPICAEKAGLDRPSLEGLAEVLSRTVEVQTWLPKSAIVDTQTVTQAA